MNPQKETGSVEEQIFTLCAYKAGGLLETKLCAEWLKHTFKFSLVCEKSNPVLRPPRNMN